MVIDKIYHTRYITIQIKEMEEHTYYLSQKLHRDAATEAAMDWCTHRYSYINGKTHAERFADDFERNRSRIVACCNTLCGEKTCGGKKGCPLSLKTIHKLLGD